MVSGKAKIALRYVSWILVHTSFPNLNLCNPHPCRFERYKRLDVLFIGRVEQRCLTCKRVLPVLRVATIYSPWVERSASSSCLPLTWMHNSTARRWSGCGTYGNQMRKCVGVAGSAAPYDGRVSRASVGHGYPKRLIVIVCEYQTYRRLRESDIHLPKFTAYMVEWTILFSTGDYQHAIRTKPDACAPL